MMQAITRLISTKAKNKFITAPFIKLVQDGKLVQMPKFEAFKLFNPAESDLIQVSEDDIPVCKIISKKDQFMQKQMSKAKKQKPVLVKDIEILSVISENDLITKINKCKAIIEKGNIVKIKIRSKTGFDEALLKDVEERLKDVAKIKGEIARTPGKQPLIQVLFGRK
jgi:translation initiation factor IF-3